MPGNTSENKPNAVRGGPVLADGGAVEIVSVGAIDLHFRYFPGPQRQAAVDKNTAVNLRRVPAAAALGRPLIRSPRKVDLVDDSALAGADLAL